MRPSPSPAGQPLKNAIENAKKKLGFMGIARHGEALGAYIRVDEGKGSGSLKLYFKGDRVSMFEVKEVKPGSVVLTISGQEVTMRL